MKTAILAACAATMLTGCLSKHQCMNGADTQIPHEFDRFTRKVENDATWSDGIAMHPDCIEWFKTHPSEKEDSLKATVFPFVRVKSVIARGDGRLECEVKFHFWLGLWSRYGVAIAFDDDSGEPVGVMHGKVDRLWGLLYSSKVEGDFTTNTRATQSRWLLNAFGKTCTHSGKKRSYYFWIPFERQSEMQDVAAAK